MGCIEAADRIVKGINGAIAAKRVTYDFARLMEGATEVECSEFGHALIANMWRAVIVPQGPANMVLIDQERVLCDATAAFPVDPATLFGRCRPDPTTSDEGQRRIDERAWCWRTRADSAATREARGGA